MDGLGEAAAGVSGAGVFDGLRSGAGLLALLV